MTAREAADILRNQQMIALGLALRTESGHHIRELYEMDAEALRMAADLLEAEAEGGETKERKKKK